MSTARVLNRLKTENLRALSSVCDLLIESREKYLTEWFGRVGQGGAVARPATLQELQEVVRYCDRHRIGLTTFSGNTGLVGGTLSREGELVVSLEKLNKVIDIDPLAATTTVESGVILQNLQEALADHHLSTPHDLGARGSCTVGGNISTHAGGLNFIRNGPLRGHIIGLEVVLADGTVVNSMGNCWKDNTGLDLKQLFIGSEGSLGIISKARIHCPPLLRYKSLALLHSPKPFNQSVLRFLALAQRFIGESLSAFEFFDAEGATILDPLPIASQESGFTVIVEASGAAPVDDRIESFIESLGEDAANGIMASDLEGMKKIWHYREHLPVAMSRIGPNMKFDVSLPQSAYYDLVQRVRLKFDNSPNVLKIVGYGHVGDGNLHLNIATTLETPPEFKAEISAFVYNNVRNMNGSISAEHGIGYDKLHQLQLSKSPTVIRISNEIKRLFDPNGILNPGRTIPPS